jgi:hypothetical protein
MAYNPNVDHTQSSGSGNFPGTQPHVAPSGLTAQWANTAIVVAPPAKADPKKVGSMVLARPAAQTKLVGQMLLEFDQSTADPEQVQELQQLLWNGGFYGKSKKPTFTPGEKDTATRNAFTRALKEAAHGQEPFGSFLDKRAQARISTGAAAAATATASSAPSAYVSNPIDIRNTIEETAQEKLGRGAIPAGQMNQMVASFQAAEKAPQVATSGTATKAPTAANFADDALHRASPVAYDAHAALNAFDAIAQLMRGGSLNG